MEEIDKSFNVICIDPKKSTQLFKGSIYKCIQVIKPRTKSLTSNIPFKIGIRNLTGSFNIDQFRLEDGSKIPEIELEYQFQYKRIDDDKLEIGHSIMCSSSSLKTIIKGKLYHVMDIRWSNRNNIYGSKWIDKIQIKENGRWYSKWHFESVDMSILREIGINKIIGESSKELDDLTIYEKVRSDEDLFLDLITSISDAINYKKKTENSNVSIIDIIKKRSFNKKDIEANSFEILKNINWDILLNSNKVVFFPNKE